MDDAELVRRIKNSFAAGKSESEITRNLLSRGYKLEYISLLIRKARGNHLLLKMFFAFVFMGVGVLLYFSLFSSQGVKLDLINPLEELDNGRLVGFTGQVVGAGSAIDFVNVEEKGVNDSEIIVTPDFISYLLNELGAWQLRSNMLTGEPARISFVLGSTEFYSVIDDSIETYSGHLDDVDLVLYTTDDVVIRALRAPIPEDVVIESFDAGISHFEVISSKPDLLAKGYLQLASSLGFSLQ